MSKTIFHEGSEGGGRERVLPARAPRGGAQSLWTGSLHLMILPDREDLTERVRFCVASDGFIE